MAWFLGKGCPNFDEIFFGASVHEKNESIFWLLGCLKNAENVKIVKNQVFEKFQFLTHPNDQKMI